MDKNITVFTFRNDITVVKGDNEVRFFYNDDKTHLCISCGYTNDILIKISGEDSLKYELLLFKVKEYSEKLTLEAFNNFFSDNTNIKNIEDLDD